MIADNGLQPAQQPAAQPEATLQGNGSLDNVLAFTHQQVEETLAAPKDNNEAIITAQISSTPI